MTVTINGSSGLTANDGSVFTTAAGLVGIGTSSPGYKLTVNGRMSYSGAIGEGADTTLSSTGTTIRLAESSTWQIVSFYTAGSERARITSGGRLNIGTTGGSATRLEIEGGETMCALINTSATDANYKTSIAFTDSGGTTRGTIRVNNSATQYNTSSDYRLKEDITPMTGALEKVAALRPCNFKWKIDGTPSQGFIAHELQEVVPDCVSGEKDAVETVDVFDENGNVIGIKERPVYQGIDTSFLVATLTAAIQELKAELDALKAQVAGAQA